MAGNPPATKAVTRAVSRKLMEHIIRRSKSKQWLLAQMEWELDDIVDAQEEYSRGFHAQCPCGHRVRYMCHIRNIHTGKVADVGSTCISHFTEHGILRTAARQARESLRRGSCTECGLSTTVKAGIRFGDGVFVCAACKRFIRWNGYTRSDAVHTLALWGWDVIAKTRISTCRRCAAIFRVSGDVIPPNCEKCVLRSSSIEILSTADLFSTDDSPSAVELSVTIDVLSIIDPPVVDGKSTSDKNTSDESADNEGTGDESADNEGTGDESADDKSVGDESADDESAGDESADDETSSGAGNEGSGSLRLLSAITPERVNQLMRKARGGFSLYPNFPADRKRYHEFQRELRAIDNAMREAEETAREAAALQVAIQEARDVARQEAHEAAVQDARDVAMHALLASPAPPSPASPRHNCEACAWNFRCMPNEDKTICADCRRRSYKVQFDCPQVCDSRAGTQSSAAYEPPAKRVMLSAGASKDTPMDTERENFSCNHEGIWVFAARYSSPCATCRNSMVPHRSLMTKDGDRYKCVKCFLGATSKHIYDCWKKRHPQ